jgi:UDP-N-acetylglucosamine 1-carboxyvinyltransferase
MDSIRVQGTAPLQGKVKIQGSKNAALPILAASLLMEGQVLLENVPKISDVYGMLHILEELGCHVRWERELLRVDSRRAKLGGISAELAKSMRSSIFLLGPMLSRFHEVTMEYPGGCVIGKRPIDLHLEALRRMGVQFVDENGQLRASVKALHPAALELPFPSVGATENVIMAAVKTEGVTLLRGAAREPEVQVLCEFLNSCGASILGIGTNFLRIEGVKHLRETRFRIPSDRIVAGTYLLAGFSCGGSMFLEEAPLRHMEAVCSVAQKMGATLTVSENGIYAQFPERAGELPLVRTNIYPGFPTDLQSVLLAVRCTGRGKTLVQENIFENRFRIIDELKKMGACFRMVNEREVEVTGVPKLLGASMEARELRGGAALVVAALGAKGESRISGRRFIDRGYENICRDLRELGARIVSE